MNEKPIIGITMGDPASIGPEITIKALINHPDVYDRCRPIVIGDACVMEAAKTYVGMPDVRINAVQSVSDAKFEKGTIDVYDMKLVDIDKLELGKVSVMAGNAAFAYVKKDIELAMANEVDGTVTNALNKEAMNKAGHHFDGHTEIYAHYTHADKYCMMLAHKDMRVTHVSTHCSLRQACERCKKDRVLDVIRMSHQACLDLGIENPRVAVAGLNPHCGEGGLFGDEEINEITPAIEQAQAEGINVVGPIPPDTVHCKLRGGWYDIVVCMYHDQGHIPLKLIGFVYNREKQQWDAVEGINLTLGLPIVRVSVDHGTAFDQAGTGMANELSLLNSIEYGIRLSIARKAKMAK